MSFLFWYVCNVFRDDRVSPRYETRDMPSKSLRSPNVVGRRMRSRREELGWSQEKVGVLIGIDESSSRARISRYELGTHEPPVRTARLIADALGVPLEHLYCEDDDVAALLLALAGLKGKFRQAAISRWLKEFGGQG